VKEAAEGQRIEFLVDHASRTEVRAAGVRDACLDREGLGRALELAGDLGPGDQHPARLADCDIGELDVLVAPADQDGGRAGFEEGVAPDGLDLRPREAEGSVRVEREVRIGDPDDVARRSGASDVEPFLV
jgi:hypothetical protein